MPEESRSLMTDKWGRPFVPSYLALRYESTAFSPLSELWAKRGQNSGQRVELLLRESHGISVFSGRSSWAAPQSPVRSSATRCRRLKRHHYDHTALCFWVMFGCIGGYVITCRIEMTLLSCPVEAADGVRFGLVTATSAHDP